MPRLTEATARDVARLFVRFDDGTSGEPRGRWRRGANASQTRLPGSTESLRQLFVHNRLAAKRIEKTLGPLIVRRDHEGPARVFTIDPRRSKS